MGTKIEEALTLILKKFPRYWEDDNLIKNKVVEDLRNDNTELLSAVMKDEIIKNSFFIKIEDNYIFQKDKLIDVLRYKSYWHSSYTKYANKIGLTSEGKYLDYNSDVVLDFPHKDCVLEGGMTNEDVAKKELYFHSILGKEEIDVLLEPKIFDNIKRYDEFGEHIINSFQDDENLIIKGNNLIALYSIKERYQNKANLIFIDIPYNTGNDGFKYNDRFNHSTWLTFMKNRLDIAKELLHDTGNIIVQVDHNEQAYIKVLMDEVFGRENFRNQIAWPRSSSGKTVSRNLPNDVDYLLWYSKSKNYKFKNVYKPLSENTMKMYSKNDNDGRGKYRLYPLQKTSSPGPETTYDYIDNDGKLWKCPKKGWRMNKNKLKALENDNRLYKTETSISEKAYWNEREDTGKLSNNLWDDIYNLQGNNGEKLSFDGQKPEKLIKKVIEMTTVKNDLVVDFFLGTGTTTAVAHKMNRKYIGIEQMDYIEKYTVNRMRDVIKGDTNGISKEVGWNGGGHFIFMELKKLNIKLIENIVSAKNSEDLNSIVKIIMDSGYINYKVNEFEKIRIGSEEFNNISLNQKKEILIHILDNNQLYLNYSEIEDESHDVSENLKQFNHSFYEVNKDV